MTAIYIHYPYCLNKCPYCDFNSHVKKEVADDEMIRAYKNEIDFFANNIVDNKINSIFFGGGTPSLMPIAMVEFIIEYILKKFNIDKNIEISLEANPTSVEAQNFLQLKNIGINRISLGIQAFNSDDLKFLGRQHSVKEAIYAIELAKKNFNNFSFDLIYTRPNQQILNWEAELKYAISFESPHLSLYQLTIEKGTKFYKDYRDKKFLLPNEEDSRNFFEITNQIMHQNNFINYEISNYAKKNFECRHNLNYWLSHDYIGIGAGAHSRVFLKDNKLRYAISMIYDPNNWVKSHKNFFNAILNKNTITKNELIEEVVMMGLRLEIGLSEEILYNFFNKNFEDIFNFDKLNFLIENKLIIFYEEKNVRFLKISAENKVISNAIIHKIIDAIKYNELTIL
jgi:putative oxygen-independent coproporphyrinogen III oxidase